MFRTGGGNFTDDNYSINITKLDWGTKAITMGRVNTTYAFIENIVLGFTGCIHAIAVRNPRNVFPNNVDALNDTIRYRRNF